MDDHTLIYQITAPHFVAGIIVGNKHVVIEAAPIVHYMVGWEIGRVMGYVKKKQWKMVRVQRKCWDTAKHLGGRFDADTEREEGSRAEPEEPSKGDRADV